MLTKKQILKLRREKQNSGFYEPDFDKWKGSTRKIPEKKYTVKLKLVDVELSNGDVVIKKNNLNSRKEKKSTNLWPIFLLK